MINKKVNDNCSRTLSSVCYWWMWPQWNLLGVLHPGPFLMKAASRLSLKWLRQGSWVAWVEEGQMTLLHMILHRAGLSRDPLCTSFPCPTHKNTTIHLIWSNTSCCLTVRHSTVQWKLREVESSITQKLSPFCIADIVFFLRELAL
jgi:hypothetical protein